MWSRPCCGCQDFDRAECPVLSKLLIAFCLGASAGALGIILLRPAITSPGAMRTELLAKPEFLADHPEILERVRTVLLNRKLAAEGSQRVQLIRGKWQFLSHAAFTPTLGRPNAPLVLLEFTDYTCEPCRASAPFLREALKGRKDVRVAILLFPIGGAVAEYAARIAIAAYRQDPERFAELHTRLMEDAGALTQERLLNTVRELNFDMDQIQRDAQSDEIRRYLQQVRLFSEDMELSGVPAFILNDKLVMGGVGATQLRELIGLKDKAI